MKKNSLFTKKLLLILAATFFLSGCQWNQVFKKNYQYTTPETPLVTPVQETSFSLTAKIDNITAETLLRESSLRIEFVDFGEAGKFISSINGLASNDNNYWAFYLNNKSSNTGVSQTILKTGDIITLTYEDVKAN